MLQRTPGPCLQAQQRPQQRPLQTVQTRGQCRRCSVAATAAESQRARGRLKADKKKEGMEAAGVCVCMCVCVSVCVCVCCVLLCKVGNAKCNVRAQDNKAQLQNHQRQDLVPALVAKMPLSHCAVRATTRVSTPPSETFGTTMKQTTGVMEQTKVRNKMQHCKEHRHGHRHTGTVTRTRTRTGTHTHAHTRTSCEARAAETTF